MTPCFLLLRGANPLGVDHTPLICDGGGKTITGRQRVESKMRRNRSLSVFSIKQVFTLILIRVSTQLLWKYFFIKIQRLRNSLCFVLWGCDVDKNVNKVEL